MTALALAALLWAGVVGPPPTPAFWWAEGRPAPPVVTHAGGEAWATPCVDDGAGALRCVVAAQGWWWRVEIDGVTVGYRVALPLVRSGP